jgi:hypothetical protein
LKLRDLLCSFGDARLVCDPLSGLNHYGCAPEPRPGLPSFASSTASTISPEAWAAAEALLAGHPALKSLGQPADFSAAQGWALAPEFDRVRAEVSALLGLSKAGDPALIFADSGTDLHLLVSQLCLAQAAQSGSKAPLRIVSLEASESGQAVPLALCGRHPSQRSALGGAVDKGAMLEAAAQGVELVEVQARDSQGGLRDTQAVDADFKRLVSEGLQAGQRVLLILEDCSKTGLLAPSPGLAAALAQANKKDVLVLVDACQGRLDARTLIAYLKRGFLVTLTGSKFITGPSFSGCLLVPYELIAQFQPLTLTPSLAAYSAMCDWPQDWEAQASLTQVANPGLLLRWEAALAELRPFSRLDGGAVDGFVRDFARAIQERLAKDPCFEPVPVPAILDRQGIAAQPGWDGRPTIFPFLLRRNGILGPDQTQGVYKTLLAAGIGQLGQPAGLGSASSRPLSALRLSLGMRQVVDALQGRGVDAVIQDALSLLDAAAGLF